MASDLLPKYTASASLSADCDLNAIPNTALVAQLMPFFVGPKGDPGDGGATSFVSTDVDNRLRTGSDEKLFVPDDLASDPVAYYILAKN